MEPTRCPACGRLASPPELRGDARRQVIKGMLDRPGFAPTQAAIRAALRIAGHRVTQATVCRDLARIGAVRHARTRWALPTPEPEPAGARP